VAKGPADDKLIFKDKSQTELTYSVDHTALYRTISDAADLARGILIHVMEGTHIGYRLSGGMSIHDTNNIMNLKKNLMWFIFE